MIRSFWSLLIWFVAYRVVRIRRRHVESCVRRAGLPDETASAMFRELATSLVELLWVALGWLTPADVVDIPDDTARRIQAALARGPVMLWCAHTSNWELLAMRAAALFPLALVVKRQGVGLADRFIQRQRKSAGLRIILPHGALAEARAAFSAGEVVATVIDQVPARGAHGDLASFLGAPALVDRAPAVLAKRARAHVFVIFAVREAGQVRARLVAELPPAQVGAASARELMARATVELDAHVRAHPASWLWLHRRWRRVVDHAVSAMASGRSGTVSDGPPSAAPPKTFLLPEKEVIESTS